MPMLSKKERSLLDAISERASEHDVEIVTVEVMGSSRSPVIRVYIDTDDGVSFAELSESQEWIGALMDEIDPFPGAYTLEVSSPGIDRPLRTAEHFERFEGETAKVRTTEPIDGSSSFKGTIAGVAGDVVTIEVDGEPHAIPIPSMKRANLVGKVSF